MKNFLLTLIFLFCICMQQVQCTPRPQHKAKVCDQRDITVVTLYSANWCGWCATAEKFLVDNDILFVKRDISDPENLKLLQEDALASGFHGNINVVPIFVVGTQMIVGYDPVSVMAAVEKEILAKWMIINRR